MMKRLFLSSIMLTIITGMAILPFRKRRYMNAHSQKLTIMLPDTTRVVLEKTSFNDMPVLFIHDTAATTGEIGRVFNKNYGVLMQFVQANNLSPLKFIGWYYTTQPPWVMDVGVQVNTLPAKTNGHIQAKIEIGGEVLVAHVWGPYNQVAQGYKQIQDWLQQNNRKVRENPFEVYVNDPATVVNPSDIQTDIYQPLE